MVLFIVVELGPSIGRTRYANVLAIQGTYYMMKAPSAGVACSNLPSHFCCRRVADDLIAVLIPNGLADVPLNGDGIVWNIEKIHQRLEVVPCGEVPECYGHLQSNLQQVSVQCVFLAVLA